MIRYLGLFAIIPATLLLTLSFFVLVVLSKTNYKEIKSFAIFIVILLWLSSALVVSLGAYIVTTGHHPLFQIMHREMMKDMMMHKGAMMMHQQDKNSGGKMMAPANPAN